MTWIALAGNPNTGKSTLFSALTGLGSKTSNYPGATVERRLGQVELTGQRVTMIDVPGTYSLIGRSQDEHIAIAEIVGLDAERPACVVVCVDATQLARSAYLLLQLQELTLPCVVALTMVDEAGAAAPDPAMLTHLFGCPVIAVTARTGHGLNALRDAIARQMRTESTAPVWRWQPSAALQEAMRQVRGTLPAAWHANDALALWVLQSASTEEPVQLPMPAPPALSPSCDDEPALGRWAWLDHHVTPLLRPTPRSQTERVDRWLLHRAWGFALFLAIMSVVFMSLFAWADPAIALVESVMQSLGAWVGSALPHGIMRDFVVEGVIAGVGGVLVFLPQILLLFFFLGLLEDCGYMARVAFLVDRVMRSMNLHGRAFIPMLSGFACAVPAILATRTMERQRDRLLTMMVVPLMTCSARLPVYALIIGAIFGDRALVASLLMVGMYLFSIVMALAAAWILSRVLPPLRQKRLPFVIELPPYRWPRVRDVVRSMWSKAMIFLKEAGTLILACSIALWALLYFPRHDGGDITNKPALVGEVETAALEAQQAAAQLEQSYAGRLGKWMEPALAPLGFDWKVGIGLIGAFAAREVFVATMGIVYAIPGDVEEDPKPLHEALAAHRDRDGRKIFTPVGGMALMVFFALASQCISTLGVVKRESRSWRWPAFLFFYMTTLAYIASLVVAQVGKLLTM